MNTAAPVGASLLAIAAGQPIKMLNLPPSSRAGSLPQVAHLNRQALPKQPHKKYCCAGDTFFDLDWLGKEELLNFVERVITPCSLHALSVRIAH
ncbi:hypothetical protein EI534_27150 [Pseudomonas frederiksbergensis]|nr:hypothetical protein [Pseudomonas frederiksbergensis]